MQYDWAQGLSNTFCKRKNCLSEYMKPFHVFILEALNSVFRYNYDSPKFHGNRTYYINMERKSTWNGFLFVALLILRSYKVPMRTASLFWKLESHFEVLVAARNSPGIELVPFTRFHYIDNIALLLSVRMRSMDAFKDCPLIKARILT